MPCHYCGVDDNEHVGNIEFGQFNTKIIIISLIVVNNVYNRLHT